jgi:hypothetical protein
MSNVYANPASWGPPAWVFLHCVSLTYPKNPSREDKLHYRTFFESLVHVLPCKLCRKEYLDWIRAHPIQPHLSSRKKLSLWLIQLHNNVNLKKNKPLVASEPAALARIRRNCESYHPSEVKKV